MKKFRMPFEYWEDDHTRLLRQTKSADFLDPEYYVRAHFCYDESGNGPYFLNFRGRGFLKRDGPFKEPYCDGEKLVDKHKGQLALILCPGPSLAEFLELVPILQVIESSKVVVYAVNSAGFLVNPNYWVICESGYAKWGLANHFKAFQRKTFVATARVAIYFRRYKVKVKQVYVVRWEEEFVVPPRTPAVSTTNALVTAWEAGAKEAFLVGCDLSKPGRPYVAGVPYTEDGAKNPFDDQCKALAQFYLPDFSVKNGSFFSKDIFKEFLSYKDMADQIKELING